ncbi:MAG: transglycosylase domain-containing protein [Pseudomonadota bacterium]
MRLASKAITAIVFFVVSMGSVTAQDTEPKLPSPEQIRQLYREASANWHTTPPVATQAFVAAEDRFFYERSVGRSTITQQVGSWYLLPGAGRLQRIAFARVIGEELSHKEVLDWFVNQVFLGQTCFGVFDAAATYFGIAVRDLNLEQAAYLAALPKSPALFHPVQSYERAVERRNFVLNEMQRAGFISADEAQRAIQSDLAVKEPLGRCEMDQ